MAAKIFCVGLPRCGGQSLTRALSLLLGGGPVVHSPGKDLAAIERCLGATEVFLPIPFLEVRWPGSTYIMNERDSPSWMESCESVYGESHDWNHPLWKYPLDAFRSYREWYQWERAKTPFASVHRIDIRRDGWKSLCDILDKPVPEIPFPRMDRFKTATYSKSPTCILTDVSR